MKKLLELCLIYVDMVKAIDSLDLVGIYRADSMRCECHEQICSLLGVDKEKTFIYTRDLGQLGYDGKKLYKALLTLKEEENGCV